MTRGKGVGTDTGQEGNRGGEGGQVVAVKTPILGRGVQSGSLPRAEQQTLLFLSLTSCLIAGVPGCITAREG